MASAAYCDARYKEVKPAQLIHAGIGQWSGFEPISSWNTYAAAMNHDSLVSAITALFPGLTTIPPSGIKAPQGQTSFWIPGLSRQYGRVVRIHADGRLKRVPSTRRSRSSPQASMDVQFEGTLDELRSLLKHELNVIRALTNDLGIQFPADLEAIGTDLGFQVGSTAEKDSRGELENRSMEPVPNREWTDAELSATVECYREMLSLVAAGTPFIKATYYRRLSERFDHVPGAFERRMQNISHLLAARGVDWLQGLKPQRNIGAHVAPRLMRFLEPLFNESKFEDGYPDELTQTEKVIEGAKRQVTVNAYERDHTAKSRCIKKWGSVCVVCAFDFGAAYGEFGQGFIHVHHLRPIHTIGKSYELDPENDLRPICPNCHSMLHRQKKTLSIEELIDLIKWHFVAPSSHD